MTEPLQLPPPLEGDISLRTLGRLAGRLDNIDLSVLMVFLVDIVDSSALHGWASSSHCLAMGWELGGIGRCSPHAYKSSHRTAPV